MAGAGSRGDREPVLAQHDPVLGEHGLESLLLGRVSAEGTPAQPAPAKPAPVSAAPRKAPGASGGSMERYKLKCPSCAHLLAFEEGCVKCYGCGFSQC